MCKIRLCRVFFVGVFGVFLHEKHGSVFPVTNTKNTEEASHFSTYTGSIKCIILHSYFRNNVYYIL